MFMLSLSSTISRSLLPGKARDKGQAIGRKIRESRITPDSHLHTVSSEQLLLSAQNNKYI
jgi:hypothetical protein